MFKKNEGGQTPGGGAGLQIRIPRIFFTAQQKPQFITLDYNIMSYTCNLLISKS